MRQPNEFLHRTSVVRAIVFAAGVVVAGSAMASPLHVNTPSPNAASQQSMAAVQSTIRDIRDQVYRQQYLQGRRPTQQRFVRGGH